MKKLVLIFLVLGYFINVGFAEMSEVEWQLNRDICSKKEPVACQALIDNGLVSVEQCNKDNCIFVGTVYALAGHSKEAILYYKKATTLGDNRGYILIGDTYRRLQDYLNAKKYYEVSCNKKYATACYNLGVSYLKGQGTNQNDHIAKAYFLKSCNLGDQMGCDIYKQLNELGI